MFENTKLVYKKMVHDIDLAVHIVDIIIQTLFIGFYVYIALINFKSNWTLFYLYLALCGICLVWLLITIFRSSFKKDQKHKIRKIIKIIKWSIRALVIGFNIYLVVRYPHNDLQIMMIILSTLFLLSQIGFELICDFVRHYYDLLVYSIMTDAEEAVGKAPKLVKAADKISGFGIIDKIKDFAGKTKEKHIKEEELNKIKSDKKD